MFQKAIYLTLVGARKVAQGAKSEVVSTKQTWKDAMAADISKQLPQVELDLDQE